MSRIREAAAAFIETGRALGHYEQAKADVAYLDECAERGLHLDPKSPEAQAVAAALRSAADFQRDRLQTLDREAIEYRMGAERLIFELEGGLALRLARTLAAARAAWRRR